MRVKLLLGVGQSVLLPVPVCLSTSLSKGWSQQEKHENPLYWATISWCIHLLLEFRRMDEKGFNSKARENINAWIRELHCKNLWRISTFPSFPVLFKGTVLKAGCCFSMLRTDTNLAESVGQVHKCRMMLRSIFSWVIALRNSNDLPG